MRSDCGSTGSRRARARFQWLLTLLLAASSLLSGCGLKTERRQMPAEIDAAVASITADIAAGRYEKVYNEASELWRQDSSLEQSTVLLKTLNEKLGTVKHRTVHTAIEQENSGGDLKGRVFIVTYRTTFERGEGMESFTFVERNRQWLLARYRISSTELK